MLTLIQVINRMILLGYTREGVTTILNLVKNSHMSAELLFIMLGCEIPNQLVLQRFKGALNNSDSAIHITFLKQEENHTA